MTEPGACGDPGCYVLHADPSRPIHPPDYEPKAGAKVSTETLAAACRTLGECTPDYCAGAGEPPTCRFCARLDIEEPCLLDPIRQEAEHG